MEPPAPDLSRPEKLRRFAKMAGEPGDLFDIGRLGSLGEIADPHVLDHGAGASSRSGAVRPEQGSGRTFNSDGTPPIGTTSFNSLNVVRSVSIFSLFQFSSRRTASDAHAGTTCEV